MYRRPDLPTEPADDFRGVDPLDPLTGAVPTWRLDEDPLYLECVRDLPVEVEVVEVSGSSRLDDEVDEVLVDVDPPTRALQLVPPVDDVEHVVVECPDCGATGPDPCRPKSNPATGKPLTRQHRRRRELTEQREAGRGDVLLLLAVVALVLAVVGGVGALLAVGAGQVQRQVSCVVPTASGCEVGP